jgi:FkbM family methyltransferase
MPTSAPQTVVRRPRHETTREAAYACLNRRGLRWMLSLLGSCYVSLRRREACVIRHEANLFIHHFRDRVIVRPFLGGASPSQIDAAVRDVFFHRYTPRPGETVLDIGAGIGEEAASFDAHVRPGGRVICVEAHPTAYRCLERFVQLNRCPAVLELQLAVGDRAGIASISNDADGYSIRSAVSAGVPSSARVPLLTLDDLVYDMGLETIHLLKMNIEGSEVAALRGMRQTLNRVLNAVICCHDFLATAQDNPALRTKGEVRLLLEGSGFSVVGRDDLRPWVGDVLYATRRR